MSFSFVKRLIAVLMAIISALISGGNTPERKTDPVFTGTFLQSWPGAHWDESRWKLETDEMKRDGIEYLIIQSIADKAKESDGGKWTLYYDSDLPEFADADIGPNFVESALRACKGTGIKVIVGLTIFEDFWLQAGFTKQYIESCRISASLAKEIYARYGEEYSDTLFGFYFTPELCNNVLNTASVAQLSKGLNIVLDEMTASCGDLPLVMSPYQTNYLTIGTIDTASFWAKIFTRCHFRNGDIIAPQDAVGANFTEIEDLEKNWKMFRTLVDGADVELKLWANCESFSIARTKSIISGIALPNATENTQNVPAPMNRFAYQLDIASRYCDNIITFSYNHYLSPNQVDHAFIDAYRKYIANGFNTEKNAPDAPDNFKSVVENDGAVLTWTSALDDTGIAYYRITKNGEFLTRIECMYGEPELCFTDPSGKSSDKYVITAYDTSGNISDAVTAK